MSAHWRPDPPPRAAGPTLAPMTIADLDAVMAIESAAYDFPWTRGNFIDSLAAGYLAHLLLAPDGNRSVLGYFVAMAGVEELHLLNITVEPAVQGRGHARTLLGALAVLCRQHGAGSLWLEVRASNGRAKSMYEHVGFTQAGLRKGYYPATFGRREDAVVMRLKVDATEPPAEANDALG